MEQWSNGNDAEDFAALQLRHKTRTVPSSLTGQKFPHFTNHFILPLDKAVVIRV